MVVDDDQLSRTIVVDMVTEHPDLELVSKHENAMDAYKALKTEDIDLLFLDVEMPGMTGLELLKSVKELPQVILTTSHAKYAAESYEYDVTDFITKPVSLPRFLKAVEKAQNKEQEANAAGVGKNTIFVKADSRYVQLSLEDILYIEALGNYVSIYTPNGRYTILSTMKDIEKKLCPPDFIRVHRSHIVRLDKIEVIEDNYILIQDKNISIGKVYREELQKLVKTL